MNNTESEYKQVALCLGRALDGLNVEPALKGAIKTMEIYPKQITNNRVFTDTVWEMIETVCNKNIIPVTDEERWDFFLAGCKYLERITDDMLNGKDDEE